MYVQFTCLIEKKKKKIAEWGCWRATEAILIEIGVVHLGHIKSTGHKTEIINFSR